MELPAHVVAFVAAGVVWAGSVLARAAAAIAELTGVGRLGVGPMLLAASTSLPELAIDVSAVRLGAADLAVGDLFGSSMANRERTGGGAAPEPAPPLRGWRNTAWDPTKYARARATLPADTSSTLSLNAGAALFALVRLEVSARRSSAPGWWGSPPRRPSSSRASRRSASGPSTSPWGTCSARTPSTW